MYGLQAISAVRGWDMAGTGAIIVFCGLFILATVISQIKNIIYLFEVKLKKPALSSSSCPPKTEIDKKADLAATALDPEATAKLYAPLFNELGQTFNLADLHRIARERDFAHPHLSIKQLWDAGVIVSSGDGFFKVFK